ncbi:MAG: hypothetical protein RL697_620 [Pseudomonadota bacterium]|jgi:hypothetical protein
MDDLVRQAMAKWPNVPDCYGWLGLDARGNWYMRNDEAQQSGAFQSGLPQAKGSRVDHEKLKAFIERNYANDEQGRWYFQNGPQRVFVELESTPWVYRVHGNGEVQTHTGLPTQVQALWQDEKGFVYLQTPLGLGLVHTQDVVCLAQLLEQQDWPLHECMQAELDVRFGIVRSPAALQNRQT